MVGLGFMLGSLVIRPFLPELEAGGHGGTSEVCGDLVTANTSLVTGERGNVSSLVMETAGEQELPNLVHPFSIVGGCHFLSAVAFIILCEYIFVNLETFVFIYFVVVYCSLDWCDNARV